MGTSESLTAPERVRRLQAAHHAKAKEAPGGRFHTLSDKVWRADVLVVAWGEVRGHGGAPGVDGGTVADIEARCVERWLGGLARELKEGTCRPQAVRRVWIAKKPRGKYRALGIPCLRDRVAHTAARMVPSPIFEADTAPEQYACRPGRSAHDAVERAHRLASTGHCEVVDADLSDYFGRIPGRILVQNGGEHFSFRRLRCFRVNGRVSDRVRAYREGEGCVWEGGRHGRGAGRGWGRSRSANSPRAGLVWVSRR